MYGELLSAVGRIEEASKTIIETPFDKNDIKQRDSGFGKKLNYVSGSTVINKLNQAFDYKWSFIIKEEKIVQSLPKKKYKSNELEPQQPYVQVLGQLIIPSLGVVKEQYGTKILLGGASEQEGAAKAAATDCLKKCATLLGIGLEIYEDDSIPSEVPRTRETAPKENKTPSGTVVPWDVNDTNKLKELKAILEIADNPLLDPYAREFFNSPNSTWKDITPMNIKAFNKFLQKKAEEV